MKIVHVTMLALALYSLVPFASGCGEEPARCLTKATPFSHCDGSKLLTCPSGDGTWVDMVVKDCSASKEVCHDPLTGPASCKDPNQKDSMVEPDAGG